MEDKRINKSAIRRHINREKQIRDTKIKISPSFLEALNDKVSAEINKAIDRAKANNRNTLYRRDI